MDLSWSVCFGLEYIVTKEIVLNKEDIADV